MLIHHELCFGCGRTNIFGLLLEAERSEGGGVTGRCFIKQDHQGPDRGYAHEGIVASALIEAMSLTAGENATARAVTVDFSGAAAVGTFLAVAARVEQREADTVMLTAIARSDGRDVAQARGSYAAG